MNESILLELNRSLGKFNFSRRGQSFSFSRSNDFGRDNIHVGFSREGVHGYFALDVSIRIQDIENAINALKDDISEADSYATATIGCSLSILDSSIPNRWSLDVDFNQVDTAIENIAMPFFSKYRKIDDILSVLLNDSSESWKLCPLHSSRAIKAVEMALQYQGERFAKGVIDLKRQFFEKISDPNAIFFEDYLVKRGLCGSW